MQSACEADGRKGKNMRNMKKALAAVAAVATLASLTACGGSDGGNDAKANAGDAEKADLVFWGWDTGNTMKALIADFEKANPGITVKSNNTGTASDTQTALSNAVAAGKGAPDVVMLEDPTVTQFAVTGDLVDLTTYGADKLEDDFSAGPWSKLQYDGKPYALPIDSGPEVFFYNDAVLKKAGVVDAGGKGFLVILKGMLAALRGETMPTLETEHAARDKADFASVGDEDITFAFDTVFIVRRIDDRSIEPFREFLNGIGDSLVIGEDDEAFKVHVHTDTPGVALTEAQRYGTLELAKIENMRTQAEDLAAGRKAQSTDDLEEDGHDHAAPAPQPQELKPFGFLAVCAGDGLAAVFADLGADGIVNGGQTMNPSTESILTEVERIAAETVFVLPNNKNIIMAAQQCAGLSEKKVIVIPTATVPQGISAMMAVDPDETDAATIEQAMNAAASAVTTAQITYAARNSEFDGFAIREGDYLALLEGKLFDTDTSIGAVLEKLAAEADSRGAEFVNLFYGSDVSEEDARKAGEQFGRLCLGAEINVVSGGQPVYYYIISME